MLLSVASQSPGKTRHERQCPLGSPTEQHHRTGQLVEDAYSSSYSECNVDKAWYVSGRRSAPDTLRLAVQHVYGHIGNWGDGADHAAAHGTLGFVSSHNSAMRWARKNFDTSACFGSSNSIGEVLEKYVTLELKQRR